MKPFCLWPWYLQSLCFLPLAILLKLCVGILFELIAPGSTHHVAEIDAARMTDY